MNQSIQQLITITRLYLTNNIHNFQPDWIFVIKDPVFQSSTYSPDIHWEKLQNKVIGTFQCKVVSQIAICRTK